MSILMLLGVMALIGFLAYVLVTYIPMPQGVKTAIVVVSVIACVIYALHAMGIGIPNPTVPRI